jgi:hypothetical protein
MKFNLLLFLSLNPKSPKSFIENSEYPTCKNCVHIIEFSSDPFNKYHMSKCKLFGIKDNISGQIEHTFTKTCRSHNSLCSKEGKYYEDSNYSLL